MSKRQKGNKVVIIGDSSVGKTCIIQQYLNNTFQETTSTIGACHFQKTINDVLVEIWDTAGQEKYRGINKLFYNDAQIAILVYDITNRKSFEELKSYWIDQIKQSCSKNVGNFKLYITIYCFSDWNCWK